MAGVPILNTALMVEAIGFRQWDEGVMGILVTPWFMNLLYIPDAQKAQTETGKKTDRSLPSGEYEFIGAFEEELGGYELCSLFSPMAQFPDQEIARETARAAMEELFKPGEPQHRETDRAVPGAVLETSAPLSRRNFLRGKFFNGHK